MPLARLQSQLARHRGDPLGLQSHGDPGWVLGLCLWWWAIHFTRTVVVLGWFSGAVLENRMGLSSARHWGTPWVPVWGLHPSLAAKWEPVVWVVGWEAVNPCPWGAGRECLPVPCPALPRGYSTG